MSNFEVAQIKSDFLFTLQQLSSPILSTGSSKIGERKVINVLGGSFVGPKLRGDVMPIGGNWIWVTPDGVYNLDGRLTLRTYDGAGIYLRYTGYRRGLADVLGRLDAGEDIDPEKYYMRISLLFETGDTRYQWLNSILAIGVGQRKPDGPLYHVHAIL